MMKVHLHRDWTLGGMNPDGSGVRRRITAAQWALLAGGMVLLLPLVVLALTAMLVGMIVFVVVATVLRIAATLRSLFTASQSTHDLTRPDAEGRVNVRVIGGRDETMQAREGRMHE